MCWFSAEELGIDGAVWRRELWVDEHTALCYRFQRSWTLVRKAKPDKQLTYTGIITIIIIIINNTFSNLYESLFQKKYYKHNSLSIAVVTYRVRCKILTSNKTHIRDKCSRWWSETKLEYPQVSLG